ncbi:hypothetical protein QPK87_34495 [Kamptonema cortianum]|nr:hypothetical protein [Kamptonema cortianum]
MLIQKLAAAQLIQLGRFSTKDGVTPVRFHLEMLASYPNALNEAAQLVAAHMPEVDHLVCDVESLALAAIVSQITNIPLAYSRKPVGSAVDLCGAYDIGHPAVLILNVAENALVNDFISAARRVGLSIQETIVLCDTGITSLNCPLRGLFTLEDYLDFLVSENRLHPRQAVWIRDWQRQKAGLIPRRPGSAAP